jgi:4-hydroxy-tetrahydrodipicolinate synthase
MNTFDYMRGVFNITPTPFSADGRLDERSLATLTRHLIDKHVNGLTILGVLGEADKLSDAERERVVAVVVEAAGGRVPICVGTTHSGTDACCELSRRAVALGARAVMVGPPKLSRSSDAALRRHYLAIAAAVDVPIVVQDYPPASGVFMTVEFLASIGNEAPQCRFVKLEDDPSPPKIGELLAANPSVQVFGGLGGIMLLEELRRGAIGTMTGFAFPDILVEICRRHFAGDRQGAAEVFDRFCPLMRFENQARINVALRKHIFHKAGVIASAHIRSPGASLDRGTIADLEDLMARLKLTSGRAASSVGSH